MFKNSKCLVTGGTGMIGRQVVDILVEMNANVTSVSLDNLQLNPNAQYKTINLAYFEQCLELTRNIDYIFHVAGIKGNARVTQEMPASFLVPLLQMNTNILEASRVKKVKGIVYVSSIGAYPRPIEGRAITEAEAVMSFTQYPPMDFYPGWAKRTGELQLRAYREQYNYNNFAIVYPSNVYGPGDNFDPQNGMVIPSLMAKIRRGDDPIEVLGRGIDVRDFAFSKDVANGIIQAMLKAIRGEWGFWNLGGAIASIQTVVEILRSITHCNFQFKGNGTQSRRIMDSSKAMKELGYNITALDIGLRQTWDWFNNHSDEYYQLKNYFREAT